MTRTKKILTVVAVLVLSLPMISAAIGRVSWRLTEAPPREYQTVSLEPTQSIATTEVRVPIAELEELLATLMPFDSVPIDETTSYSGCSVPRPKPLKPGCWIGWNAKVRAVGSVNLVGSPRITVRPNGLRVTQGITGVITFHASGNFDKLNLSARETVDGTLDVTFDVALDVQPDWTLKATIRPEYTWTEPIGFNVLGIHFTIRSKVEAPLTAALNALAADLATALELQANLGEAKDAIERFGTQALRINAQPPVHLLVQPFEVGVGTFSNRDGHMVIPLLARFRASVHATPEPPTAEPTNVTFTREVPPPKVEIRLPAFADYDLISDQAADLLRDQTFPIEAGSLRGTVRVNDVAVYPAGSRLALRVTLHADLASPFPDVRASATLVATPVLDEATQTLTLTDVAYTADIDNIIARALLALRRAEVAETLESLTLDLSPVAEQARGELSAALNDVEFEPGVRVTGSVDEVAVTDLTLTEKLSLTAIVTGQVTASMGDLSLVTGLAP